MAFLEVHDVSSGYGEVQILWDVSLKLETGKLTALVGSNGVGKTTLLRTVVGLLKPWQGSIRFGDQDVTHVSPHGKAAQGIVLVPEGRQLFPSMSVHENLEMGAYSKPAWKKKQETLERVYKIFPRLKEREKQLARTLSGGEQQMVAMGRGLMSIPKLCIIDEPSNGLAPMVVMEAFKIIQELRDQGITILLIEQNIRQTLEISDRAYVLENGRIVMEGDCATCLASEHIKKAYLGL